MHRKRPREQARAKEARAKVGVPIFKKKPSDPTIAEKFNTYRFADYLDPRSRVPRVLRSCIRLWRFPECRPQNPAK